MALDPAIKEGAPVGYDDRPIHSEPGSLPPQVQAPLAPFRGRHPDAPEWFLDAIAQEPERTFVTSLGTQIEALSWGELGKPGLLLVHGNSAHADWWSFIAPFLAQDYRVTSMSLAGMGASDWRESYAFQDFAEDAEAVARATGLYDGGALPIYIGHSFGGSQVFFAAAAHPERMRAAVLVDTGFGGPPPNSPEAKRMMEQQVRNIPTGDRAARVYPTEEAALARFRFMPPQVAGNLFIADFIARRSLKRAPLPDGGGEGWTWRFDPAMWNKLDRTVMMGMTAEGPPKVTVPLVHIYGDRSVVKSRISDDRPSPLPRDMLEIAIPDSAHHIMVDQPLALIAALRGLLARWPG
ncbi:alpha/beta hydrolase [Phenylobacterium sp. 20VBR1]|uniref:Alpha/beta hydrolase n=1 Tax=Phenylobacterium glaciei TaxID=2803784 RepID=A0A941CXF1_9CAUL|nr:alpha/beta hydrolase [Phenylobacterium glaciei]MBR7618441.1 alpha/beta hydrolase [Phenylobacterium glaciei]